jgi:phage repressor protein C with HTH and peptisase S24 domain
MKKVNDNIDKVRNDIIYDIFQRLRYVEKMLFKNRSAAAAAAGVSVPTFARWVGGKDPSFEGLAQLADSVGLSLDWLATGKGQMRPDAPATTGDFVLVPLYDQRAAAGHGAAAHDEQPTGFFSFRRDWVRATLGGDPSRLAILPATGDSMEPLIVEGDLLLVDLSVTVPAGDGIYVLERDGDLLVKKVHPLLSGALIIDSLNQAYAVEAWSPGVDHGLRFVGRVRMISRAV